eukprot:NODE_4617_length_766_cov_75.039124_g4594_i0.p1 GENE.NODE_4617_length_766_cov_75.039124_g4594_i0~~NODE_4617_length_766_cov_75.039124_g4594_i0.p1  ORF type:complete len:167 (-),score=8.37 NODE_4617_length_766_cov_75.039124_g4594_i0:188-688(-)
MAILPVHSRKAIQSVNQAGSFQAAVAGTVVRRWKLREREYCDGKVFNVLLEEGTSERSIKLFFHDKWAEACSFIAEGDVVQVTNLRVEPNPAHNESATTREHPFLLTLKSDSEVKVVQHADPDELGHQTMELLLTGDTLDAPVMRTVNTSSRTLVLGNQATAQQRL